MINSISSNESGNFLNDAENLLDAGQNGDLNNLKKTLNDPSGHSVLSALGESSGSSTQNLLDDFYNKITIDGLSATNGESTQSLFEASSFQSNAFDMDSIFDRLMNLNLNTNTFGSNNAIDQIAPAAINKQSMNLTHDLDQQFKSFFSRLSGDLQKLFDTKMVPESIDVNARLTTHIKNLSNSIPQEFNKNLQSALEQDNSKMFNGSLGSLSLGNAPSIAASKTPVSRDGANPMNTKWFGTDNTQGFA
jgi:hypothetical protein